MSGKRIIQMSVLPGEPLDGSGKVCIHLFVQDEAGSFVEPHVLHPVLRDGKPVVEARPTHGRLACDPKRDPAVVVRNGVTHVTPRTDDPRACTCLKCKASSDYKRMMEDLTK